MLAPAPAADPVDVVLPHHDLDLGQVVGLVRTLHPHLRRPGQVRTAPAAALRAVRHVLISLGHPRQRTALRALLLARSRPEPFARLGAGLFRPGDHPWRVASRSSRCCEPRPAPGRSSARPTAHSPRPAPRSPHPEMRTQHNPATAATTRTHDNMITSPYRIDDDTPIDHARLSPRSAAVRQTRCRPADRPECLLCGTPVTTSPAAGASTKELMVRMGHSSTRAALIYQHATRERDRKITDGLSEQIKTARRSAAGRDDTEPLPTAVRVPPAPFRPASLHLKPTPTDPAERRRTRL